MVGDRTTAAAVLVIVALTALLVIITTVVPAWVSLMHDYAAFAPFRSPQAWIFFYIIRLFDDCNIYATQMTMRSGSGLTLSQRKIGRPPIQSYPVGLNLIFIF